MKRYFLIFSLFSLSLFSATAQTELSDYRPGATAEGAIYMLPKTAIRVSVLVEKCVYTPGEFSNYAMRYLRMKDVSQQSSTTYRIVSIKQTPFAIADSAKAFAVKFNAKTVAANFALSDDGRLLAINAHPRQQQELVPFQPAPKAKKLNPRDFMNEEILAAGSSAKMAELTAREIYDLRENRNLLIKGQADFMPNDGAQMKLMLDRLEQQERTLTLMFTGTTACDTTETLLTVIPDGDIQKQVLFRLSKRLGLVDADDLSGEPYYINVEDLKTVPPVDSTLTKKKKQPESGVYINVPGRMRSTIYRDRAIFSKQDMPAAQFGRVELLSGELFNKRYTTRLWLNALTGNIEKLEADQPK
jgi:hypothetical protein